ncbi:hypothetical protein OF83DRAFT_1168946 [Amylostereum chailletii]|nr:hypothetical protein OF83DRAFT_1168946 [Amylostereum chailletii]
MSYDSITHRVLAIPELLGLIFSFGDRLMHYNSVLVCKQWSNIALDSLWREVDDLYHLLQLLCPMVDRCDPEYRSNYGHASWCFTRIPTSADWARFNPYARRVRSLKYGVPEPALDPHHLSDNVFNDLARTRTSLAILPNLRCLWWLQSVSSAQQHQTVFMHEGVTEYRMYVSIPHDVSFEAYSSDITERMPHLTDLVIDHIPALNGASIAAMLRALPKLKRVLLPKHALHGPVLTELGRLPELEVIGYDSQGGLKTHESHINVSPEPGAFPVLWDLGLGSTLTDMKHFLVGGALLPKLTHLFLESINVEEPASIQDTFSAIAEGYPQLKSFSVDIGVDILTAYTDNIKPLSFEHIRPLLPLHQLTTLEIRHNLSLCLSEESLVELGTALPNLQNLLLNCDPLRLGSPSLTLHALLPLAEFCPNLRRLGLYVDACATETLTVPKRASKPRFTSLRYVNFGTSPIGTSVVPVALFLSALFADADADTVVKVEAGVMWNEDLFVDDVDGFSETTTENCMRWGEVAKMMPLLVPLRRDEKSRRAAAELELEDLKMMNEVLTERAKLKGVDSSAWGSRCIVN